jgi:hypothetical protein
MKMRKGSVWEVVPRVTTVDGARGGPLQVHTRVTNGEWLEGPQM